MLNALNKNLKALARKVGLVVARRNDYTDPGLRLQAMLDANAIDVIIDVGANEGQFARNLIEEGFPGRIYSIEPMPDYHAKLLRIANSISSNWMILEQCAISDTSGTAQFNILANQASSSLLSPRPTTELLTEIFSIEQRIEVPTKTIAAICEENHLTGSRIFLKLDIQGAEKLALLGSVPVMHAIQGVIIEMPLGEFYEGQEGWREIDHWLTERGYSLWDIEQVWRAAETGRLYHVDMTYFRST